jgi:hypothetical protein
MLDGSLYRVAASPVFTRQLGWAGTIILGQAIDNDFAGTLAANLDAQVNFYVGEQSTATSDPVQIHGDITKERSKLEAIEEGLDCQKAELVMTEASGKEYATLSARLPGEAGMQGAYYTIFAPRAEARGFMATLKAVKKNDLAFGKFPWIGVVFAFVLIIGLGFFFMIFEVDLPVKRLAKDTVALAQGDIDRLNEPQHKGRYGSMSRSVNIAIDKLHRDSKAAKQDLDQLLGPAPSASGVDASALPAIGPGGDAGPGTPPPPSEFKFGGGPGPGPADTDLGLTPPPSSDLGIAAPPPGLTPPPPSAPDKTPPPMPAVPTNKAMPPKPVALPDAIDEDILADEEPEETKLFEGPRPFQDEGPTKIDDSSAHFKEIFDKFISLKQECGENVDNLTFERFSQKLRTNSDALIAKHGCRSVKFQVYVKDGKAALKASPVR